MGEDRVIWPFRPRRQVPVKTNPTWLTLILTPVSRTGQERNFYVVTIPSLILCDGDQQTDAVSSKEKRRLSFSPCFSTPTGTHTLLKFDPIEFLPRAVGTVHCVDLTRASLVQPVSPMEDRDSRDSLYSSTSPYITPVVWGHWDKCGRMETGKLSSMQPQYQGAKPLQGPNWTGTRNDCSSNSYFLCLNTEPTPPPSPNSSLCLR